MGDDGIKIAQTSGSFDIDWNSKYVMVRRSVVEARITRTKTGRIRKVDLSDALLSELKALRKHRQAAYLKEGENEIPEWIFCNAAGNPIDMRGFKRRVFRKVLRKAKLRTIRFS